jgi:hypothetical protein
VLRGVLPVRRRAHVATVVATLPVFLGGCVREVRRQKRVRPEVVPSGQVPEVGPVEVPAHPVRNLLCRVVGGHVDALVEQVVVGGVAIGGDAQGDVDAGRDWSTRGRTRGAGTLGCRLGGALWVRCPLVAIPAAMELAPVGLTHPGELRAALVQGEADDEEDGQNPEEGAYGSSLLGALLVTTAGQPRERTRGWARGEPGCRL